MTLDSLRGGMSGPTAIGDTRHVSGVVSTAKDLLSQPRVKAVKISVKKTTPSKTAPPRRKA